MRAILAVRGSQNNITKGAMKPRRRRPSYPGYRGFLDRAKPGISGRFAEQRNKTFYSTQDRQAGPRLKVCSMDGLPRPLNMLSLVASAGAANRNNATFDDKVAAGPGQPPPVTFQDAAGNGGPGVFIVYHRYRRDPVVKGYLMGSELI